MPWAMATPGGHRAGPGLPAGGQAGSWPRRAGPAPAPPGISRAGRARAIAALAQAINLGERAVEQTWPVRREVASRAGQASVTTLWPPGGRSIAASPDAMPRNVGRTAP